MTRRASKNLGVYARMYVSMLRKAKHVERTDLAWRLYVSAILWCRDEGNGGYIPNAALVACVPGRTKRKLLAAADELAAAGLWIGDMEGWEINDYETYQDGPETIEANSSRTRAAAAARWGGEPEP